MQIYCWSISPSQAAEQTGAARLADIFCSVHLLPAQGGASRSVALVGWLTNQLLRWYLRLLQLWRVRLLWFRSQAKSLSSRCQEKTGVKMQNICEGGREASYREKAAATVLRCLTTLRRKKTKGKVGEARLTNGCTQYFKTRLWARLAASGVIIRASFRLAECRFSLDQQDKWLNRINDLKDWLEILESILKPSDARYMERNSIFLIDTGTHFNMEKLLIKEEQLEELVNIGSTCLLSAHIF